MKRLFELVVRIIRKFSFVTSLFPVITSADNVNVIKKLQEYNDVSSSIGIDEFLYVSYRRKRIFLLFACFKRQFAVSYNPSIPNQKDKKKNLSRSATLQFNEAQKIPFEIASFSQIFRQQTGLRLLL